MIEKIDLEIKRRGSDYHCQLKKDSKVWECGATPEEALGKWLITHGKDFGIEISTK